MSKNQPSHLLTFAQPRLKPEEATSRLINAFCHDCRTPLAIIAEVANILRDGFSAGDTVDVIEFLGLISKRVVEIEGYISDYQTLNLLSILLLRENQYSTTIGDLFDQFLPALQQTLHQFGHSLICHFDPAMPIINHQPFVLSRAIPAMVERLAKTSATATQIVVIAAPSDDGLGIQLSLVRSDKSDALQDILSAVGELANHAPLDSSDADFRVLVADALIGYVGGHLHCIRQKTCTGFIMHLPVAAAPVVAEHNGEMPDDTFNEASHERRISNGIKSAKPMGASIR